MKHSRLFLSAFVVVAALESTACRVYVDAGGDGGGGAGGASSSSSGATGGASSSSSGATGGASSSSSGGPAVPSTPEVIVIGRAGALAVDDTYLFIGDVEPVPFRVPKTGGTPQPVVPVDSFNPSGNVTVLAIDETHVYWSSYIGAQPQFEVWRAPKDGGSSPTLLSTVVGPNNAQPFGIAVDSEYVYLTLPDIYNSNDPPEQLNGAVHRVPKAGGTTQPIATVFSRTIAADDTYVYWPRVAADYSGELIRANKDGSSQTVIAKEIGPITSVFARNGRVFWTYQESFTTYALRSSNNGAAATTLATSTESFGSPVAAADAVYWLVPGTATTGSVFKATFYGTVSEVVDAVNSPPSPIYYGAYGPRLAVDDQAVYFSYEPQSPTEGARRVYRAAR